MELKIIVYLQLKKIEHISMLIIKVKDGEKIDRALKRLKRKFRDTQVLQTLRDKKQFTKKSVERRQQIKKAEYIQSLKEKEEF